MLPGKTLLAVTHAAYVWTLLSVRSQVAFSGINKMGVPEPEIGADTPLRLNRRVNVLPHPGTGHTNEASPFLRP